MIINEMLLRRKNKVNLSKREVVNEATATEKSMVISIAKNIESLGFTMSKDLFENLLTYPEKEIEMFYADFIPKLKALVGADKEYNPMYPNFPKQVLESSDAELFINAIIHYWSLGKIMLEYQKDERMPLFENVNLNVLEVGTEEDILEIFKNLVGSKTNISQQDKTDIENIITTYTNFYNYLPDEIPLKENVAFIGKLILEKAPIKNSEAIQKYFKTPTDVLRLVTALSNGDISLAEDTKYKKLRRCERRMVMDLLSGCGNILEDMYRYQYQWIRIGEIVHPFEFTSEKYKNANKAFDSIRNKKKPLFIAGQVQNAINGKDMETAANLLKNRAGEFARHLDKLLRDATDKNYVINCFNEVAKNVSTPVLLQVYTHFKHRNEKKPIRVFFPKGNLAHAVSIPNNLDNIDKNTCRTITGICTKAIIEQFKNKESMGNVYIDSEMMNFIVPFSQRSASSGSKSIVRGSRVELNKNSEYIRAFIWWTNMNNSDGNFCIRNRVDLDLSAVMYDENWNYIDHLSYTKLSSKDDISCHSGDITDGGDPNGKGVAEFIDINLDAISKKSRYVVFEVYSYTGQKFSELPNCRFGWMQRESMQSGEIFEPSTVDMSIDVNSNSKTVIPVIFDCKKRQFIWADMSLKLSSSYNGGINLESNIDKTTATCYALANMNKPDLYTLIALNALSRGNIVYDRNEADIIFSNDKTPPIETVEIEDEITKEVKTVEREKKDVKIITAYDTDFFMGQLL